MGLCEWLEAEGLTLRFGFALCSALCLSWCTVAWKLDSCSTYLWSCLCWISQFAFRFAIFILNSLLVFLSDVSACGASQPCWPVTGSCCQFEICLLMTPHLSWHPVLIRLFALLLHPNPCQQLFINSSFLYLALCSHQCGILYQAFPFVLFVRCHNLAYHQSILVNLFEKSLVFVCL